MKSNIISSNFKQFGTLLSSLLTSGNPNLLRAANSISCFSLFAYFTATGIALSLFEIAAFVIFSTSAIFGKTTEESNLGILSALICSIFIPGYLLMRIGLWLAATNRERLILIAIIAKSRFVVPLLLTSITVSTFGVSSVIWMF